jgi:hypothetical protein
MVDLAETEDDMTRYIPTYGIPMALALFLVACGTVAEFRDQAVLKGGEAYDEGLANAELFMCRAASVGSVQRRYGRSRDLSEAWKMLCLGNPEAGLLFGPAPEQTAAP